MQLYKQRKINSQLLAFDGVAAADVIFGCPSVVQRNAAPAHSQANLVKARLCLSYLTPDLDAPSAVLRVDNARYLEHKRQLQQMRKP